MTGRLLIQFAAFGLAFGFGTLGCTESCAVN